MGYCTVDEVRASLGNIGTLEIPDPAIEDIIEESSSEIDAYIGIKYSLPLSSTPPMLERICRDLSACYLFDDYIASGMAVESVEIAHRRCQRAKKKLQDLRDGKMRLILDDGSVAPENDDSASKPWSPTKDYQNPHFFDYDNTLDYSRDREMLEDIWDKRNQ